MKIQTYFTCALLISCLQPASSQTIQVIAKKYSADVDHFIETEMEKRKIPGLVLGICDPHGFVKLKAYGYADLQNRAPVVEQSVFELASLTKQFTAGAIMLLVQEGKIKLTDPIKLHLKDCPVAWEKITIRHLLTHTSGLPAMGSGFSGLKEFSNEELNRLLFTLYSTKEDSYRAIRSDTLNFGPGENWQYSDIGYLLLGIIIDNTTGSYRKYLQKNIFDMVGMKNTYLVDQITVHPFEVRGYTLRSGELVNIRRVREMEIPAHYGIFSNVDDLRKWDSVLNTESLFRRESKDLMWQSSHLDNGIATGYGFGWNTKKMNNKTIVSHTGLTGTGIIKFVEDQVTFIVLTNLGGVAINTGGRYDPVTSSVLAFEIAEMLGYKNLIDTSYVTRRGHKVIPANKELLEKLAGSYKMSNGQPRKIILENGNLYFERGGGQRSRLAPLDDGSFLLLGVPNETIIEVVSKDYKTLRMKPSGVTLIKE